MGIDLSALDKAFKSIDKIDKSAIQSRETYNSCNFVPCSSPELNKAIGGKGLCVGRIWEIFGIESGGKSLLSSFIASDYQKSDFFVIMFDFERTASYDFLEKQGLDVSDKAFKLITPNTIHEGFEMAETLAETGEKILFIFDSVSSMLTQSEIDNSFDKASIGLQAKAMSSGLKKLVPILSDNGCTAIFINQIREKIGVMYGDPTTTSGGRSLAFYSSLRLRVRKTEDIMEKDEAIAFKQGLTVVKNKLAPPKGKAELEFSYTTGISRLGGIVDMAIEEAIINKSGGWYDWINLEGEVTKVQGKAKVIDYLESTPLYFIDLKVKLGLELPEESDTIEE